MGMSCHRPSLPRPCPWLFYERDTLDDDDDDDDDEVHRPFRGIYSNHQVDFELTISNRLKI